MPLPLVVLAAGLSTRYGRLKQLDELGPGGEAIMDYNVYDAARAGFDRFVFVVRRQIEADVRAHVDRVLGDTIDATFVCQELDHLPEGFRAPPERSRPWGTAHAVLCAAEHVEGPFGVCNADDLYGPGAFELLAGHLRTEPADTEAVVVGYRLDSTLSGAGGVSRGICVPSRGNLLAHVSEVKNIQRRDGWITGTTTEGAPVELTGQEIVSMNLWGFTPEVVDLLRRLFGHFLEYWSADTHAEYFLSTSVSQQIELGATRVKMLEAPDSWFGITHAADRERSAGILRERVGTGVYPDRLAEGIVDLRRG